MSAEREEQSDRNEATGASVIELSRQRPKTLSRPPPSLLAPTPSASTEAGPSSSRGFATTIDDASMADLVQMECLRGATRSIRVRAGGQKGLLYFEKGQLVHAAAGSLNGEAAALEILSWETGTVERSEAYFYDSPRIETSWQGLLMAAAQCRDERARGNPEPKLSLASEVSEPKTAKEEKVGILRALRLNQAGELLQSEGEVSELAETAAYALRLIELIGDGLGLEKFMGFECVGAETVLLAYVDGESVVALESTAGTNLAAYRKRSGT